VLAVLALDPQLVLQLPSMVALATIPYHSVQQQKQSPWVQAMIL
jgi:hypothetical protein